MVRPFAAVALLAAAAPAGFQPGLWAITGAPSGASLDGKPLGDLPFSGGAGPTTTCLAPEQASDSAWLTRDFAPGCAVTHQSLARGRIDITASCPPQAPGLARGAVRLAGRWTPTRYSVRFVTTNPSENGVMGFTGTMTGRRVGICPTVTMTVTPAPRP